jgi:acetylornithine deacetylase
MVDPIPILAALVETPSLSGAEGAACAVVERAVDLAGCRARRFENNVWCEKGSGERGLLFNSHLDTVPAGPGWTRDPHRAEIAGDRLYGLGATDAKSCVAAMLAAFVEAEDPGPRGRLVFAATAEEETGGASSGDGLERLLPHLGPLAAGVVGEPTAFAICNGQRGLARVVLTAEGRAGHASRPWEGVNAIEIAAEDVLALRALAAEIFDGGADPATGRPTIQATLVQGGTKANVIPARCEVTLDVRTTAAFDNDRAIERIRAAVKSRVDVRSSRFRPFATPPEAAIVRAARGVLPEAAVKPFGGVSDLFFLARAPGGPLPGIILGPGDGAQSHQADEWVSVDAVRRAAGVYGAIARAFFEAG